MAVWVCIDVFVCVRIDILYGVCMGVRVCVRVVQCVCEMPNP